MITYKVRMERLAKFKQSGYLYIQAKSEEDLDSILEGMAQDQITADIREENIDDTGDSDDWEISWYQE